MADLTAQKRKSVPKKDFAGPGKSFPINDPTHARLAISGATRAEHAGNISAEEEERIKAKARAKLHKTGKLHSDIEDSLREKQAQMRKK